MLFNRFFEHLNLYLRCAPTAIPGTNFSVQVVLICAQPWSLKELTISFLGYGGHPTIAGWSPEKLLECTRSISVHRQLEQGQHTFSVDFSLPAGIPSSYEGLMLAVRYQIHVCAKQDTGEVSNTYFPITVCTSLSRFRKKRKMVRSSHRPQDKRYQPHAELCLERADVQAETILQGSLQLANLTTVPYTRWQLNLIACEWGPACSQLDSLQTQVEGYKNCIETWTFPLNDIGEQPSLAFSVPIPKQLVPAFHYQSCRLRWILEAKIEARWRKAIVLQLPIRIHPVVEPSEKNSQIEPFANYKLDNQAWRFVAERSGFLWQRSCLETSVGACKIRITLVNPLATPLQVMARLVYPSLAIHLQFRREGDFTLLSALDAEQTKFINATFYSLCNVYSLVQASDTEMVLHSETGALHTHQLLDFAQHIRQLAQQINQCYKHIPAPTCMIAFVPAWRKAARALQGHLYVGSMKIYASLSNAGLELWTKWSEDHQPVATIIEVKPNFRIDPQYHVEWERAQGDAFKGHTAGYHENLWQDAEAFSIRERSIAITLLAPLADPQTELERIHNLELFCNRLHGRDTLYR